MPNCKENKKGTDTRFLAGGTVCPVLIHLITGDFILCLCLSPLLHRYLTPSFFAADAAAALCACLKEGDNSPGNSVAGCTWLESD